MGHLGDHRRPCGFGQIGQGIEESHYLKPAERIERHPGVLGGPGEHQRGEDHGEHDADPVWWHQGPDAQPDGAADPAPEQQRSDQQTQAILIPGRRAQDHGSNGEHQRGGNQSPHHRQRELFERNHGGRQRR